MNVVEDRNPARTGVFNRLAAVMNRAASYVSMRIHVAMANSWRDSYNPLRGLTIARAVYLLEDGERGAYADLQWTYRFIEIQDATLGALIERRTSAIQMLDWNIRVADDIPAEKRDIAARQEAALKDAYGRIGNLSAAMEAMVMASFRGYTHLEKITDAEGNVIELAPVDQWFWVRRGLYGQWQINQTAKFGTNQGEDVPLPRFIIREVSRPVNRVALIAFIRKNLSQKDWDGFIETYGIPAVFVIMPPDVPSGKEEEYLSTADAVVSDARGALPHGSDIKTVDNGARGNNPFKEHLAYQDEQIVMRGTGGLLTMLSQSGSGTLAGNAHADTFNEIAKAEAAEISEIMRKQFDAEIIERVTPGERAYAYFDLAANEETDTSAIVRDIRFLAAAGYKVPAAWIAEKTGYEIEEKKPEEKDAKRPAKGGEPITMEAERIENRYNPDQARAPKGSVGGGRWTKGGGSGPVIDFGSVTTADVKGYLEEQKQEWVEGSMQSGTSGPDETEEGKWEVGLADGTTETFDTEDEAQGRLDQEREWFESATISIDGDEASITDDNGAEVLKIVKVDGVWKDVYGRDLEGLDQSGQGQLSEAGKARAEKLISKMPMAQVNVTPGGDADDDFDFVGGTDGSEPYVIKGNVRGGTLHIDSMLPVDNTASFSGSSRGAGLLISTVEAAKESGLEEITTTGGKGGSGTMTGYRTWPALGFDARLPESQLPDDVRTIAGDPPTLLNLTSTKEGRLWWRKNGQAMDMKFDLSDGSASNKRLEQVKGMLSR